MVINGLDTLDSENFTPLLPVLSDTLTLFLPEEPEDPEDPDEVLSTTPDFEIKVFPNPTLEFITVSDALGEALSAVEGYSIHTLDGKLVAQEVQWHDAVIQLPSEAGTYLIHLRLRPVGEVSRTYAFKVVKQ